jgi:glucose/arabinose dehydrogenase
MLKIIPLVLFSLSFISIRAQSFLRSELSTSLTSPWEITYGPDDFLWLTEADGKVCRVDPTSGNKLAVYTATDYFNGDVSETWTLCHQPAIQKGTLGLALHPLFMDPATAYIYFAYSYNSNITNPSTKFKIRRLKWDHNLSTVIGDSTIVTDLPNGYDHIGGRLAAVRQGTSNYLYFTTGDNGMSEDNSPTCYVPQSANPNNFAQDINYKNGKVHRFNMNGSVPADNPVSGNSVFTRGHRNPQGLAFNESLEILYIIEHGDRTDDEINVAEKGKNYGWKWVRGYHGDNNYPGETAFIASYTLDPNISGDGLKEPLYSWCATAQPTIPSNVDWCTVAPSGGLHYASGGIPGWNNSLLVVTLKDGPTTDMEMYKFQLNPDGISLNTNTAIANPQKFFSADQALNGRLRDIAVSADGKTIFLINNGGTDRDKITVYKYDPNPGFEEFNKLKSSFTVYPDPAQTKLYFNYSGICKKVEVINSLGQIIFSAEEIENGLDISNFAEGFYTLRVFDGNNLQLNKAFIKSER